MLWGLDILDKNMTCHNDVLGSNCLVAIALSENVLLTLDPNKELVLIECPNLGVLALLQRMLEQSIPLTLKILELLMILTMVLFATALFMESRMKTLRLGMIFLETPEILTLTTLFIVFSTLRKSGRT